MECEKMETQITAREWYKKGYEFATNMFDRSSFLVFIEDLEAAGVKTILVVERDEEYADTLNLRLSEDIDRRTKQFLTIIENCPNEAGILDDGMLRLWWD